jgi:hypothetical protein
MDPFQKEPHPPPSVHRSTFKRILNGTHEDGGIACDPEVAKAILINFASSQQFPI